jgi:hypothetical protein
MDTSPFDRRHKPDIGYAPTASSCERVDNPDACTVSARDVIAAFAAFDPNLLLAKPVGFFGSERPANCSTGPITQPISDQLLFISAALSTVNASDRNSQKGNVNTQELCKPAKISSCTAVMLGR